MGHFVGMVGTLSSTGAAIGTERHLRQSVADILSTPVGSRVMRREYGSRLPSLVDRPLNAVGRLAVVAATAEALMTWEPRLDVSSVAVATPEPGKISVDIVARILPSGEDVRLEGIVIG